MLGVVVGSWTIDDMSEYVDSWGCDPRAMYTSRGYLLLPSGEESIVRARFGDAATGRLLPVDP